MASQSQHAPYRRVMGDHEVDADPPTLAVIIPVFNEVRTVEDVLRRVALESTAKEMIVVDDGSTDGTTDLLERWRSGWQNESTLVRRVVLLRHETNLGKGAAIRTGLDSAHAEFIIVQDADLEVSPEAYPDLLRPLQDGTADFVIGNRTERTRSSWRLRHRAGIVLLNWIVRLLYGEAIQDEACCFKVLRTRNLRRMNLKCRRFEFCPEVIAKAARLGLRFEQVSVSYTPRVVADGKKLRWWDGILAISTLWRYRDWREELSS